MSIAYEAARTALNTLRARGVSISEADARGFLDVISGQIDEELAGLRRQAKEGVWIIEVSCEAATWALDPVEMVDGEADLNRSYRLRLTGHVPDDIDLQQALALAALHEARPILGAAHYSFTARAAVWDSEDPAFEIDLGDVDAAELRARHPVTREAVEAETWSVFFLDDTDQPRDEVLHYPHTTRNQDAVVSRAMDLLLQDGGAILWVEPSDDPQAARTADGRAIATEAERRAALEPADAPTP